MLGINYGSNATELLGLGYGMDGQSGLTRRFGTEDLNYSAARVAPTPKALLRLIEPEGITSTSTIESSPSFMIAPLP